MALWEWALEVYARPRVAELCLELQEDHGQSVSYLLWAAWARRSDPLLLTRGADIARRWEVQALAHIRSARRGLKPGFPGVADAERESLRAEVKAAELRAERVLIDALEAMGGPVDGADVLPALQVASTAWGIVAPVKALAALADALS